MFKIYLNWAYFYYIYGKISNPIRMRFVIMTIDGVAGSMSRLNGISRTVSNFSATLTDVFTFLTVSSIFVGVTGFFQTFAGYLLFGVAPSALLCMAVFLITFSTYSLNKLTDMAEDSINMPERIAFINGKKRLILFASLGAYLLSIPLAFLATPLAVVIVFVPILANMLYSSRPLPHLPRLKDIPVMKNVFVATSWATVCTFLPAVDISSLSRATVLLVLYFMLVKVFINTTLYDVRDVKGDRESGVKTIPVILGNRRTMMILLAMNSTLVLLLPFLNGPVRSLVAAMILYGYLCIIHFRKRRDPLVLDFFADGEWMLFSILYTIII